MQHAATQNLETLSQSSHRAEFRWTALATAASYARSSSAASPYRSDDAILAHGASSADEAVTFASKWPSISPCVAPLRGAALPLPEDSASDMVVSGPDGGGGESSSPLSLASGSDATADLPTHAHGFQSIERGRI